MSEKSGLDVLAEHLAEMLYERTMEWSRDEWVMWEHLTDGERTHWRGVAATEADRIRAALPVEWSIRYPIDADPRAFVERCGAREVGPMAWRAYVVAGLLRYEGEHGTYASSRKGAERKAVRLLRKYLNSRGGAPIDVTALSIPPAGRAARAGRVPLSVRGAVMTECLNHCDHCAPDAWHSCERPEGHDGYHSCEMQLEDF